MLFRHRPRPDTRTPARHRTPGTPRTRPARRGHRMLSLLLGGLLLAALDCGALLHGSLHGDGHPHGASRAAASPAVREAPEAPEGRGSGVGEEPADPCSLTGHEGDGRGSSQPSPPVPAAVPVPVTGGPVRVAPEESRPGRAEWARPVRSRLALVCRWRI
ncbi:hypothetical protein [Streptomyces sp. HNM0574]|uniref:hypothetical protein n=1 Tax=Streptomyces sp. HNM0574 TaxID=2714954 RepID=UPI00146C1923|nr:hypothetical protein [Streptomyces sp. HNM0574]NLU68402.1 hypothetical protein [Streptomyces sp. HNM0574]